MRRAGSRRLFERRSETVAWWDDMIMVECVLFVADLHLASMEFGYSVWLFTLIV